MPFCVLAEPKDSTEDIVVGPFRTRASARKWAILNVDRKVRVWWIARFVDVAEIGDGSNR